MNENLDVLRYWLSDINFDDGGGEWDISVSCAETDWADWPISDPLMKAFVCAELRRKYLERGYGVSTYLYPDGQAQVALARPAMSFSEHSTEVMDTELLAMIEAGLKLKDALAEQPTGRGW